MGENASPLSVQTRLLAYLKLMRIPAVFTAMADIFLGFLLTHVTLEQTLSFILL